MKTRSAAPPERSRRQPRLDRQGERGVPQTGAVADRRHDSALQRALIERIGGSPRVQRRCACGAPSAAGGSCSSCELQASPKGSTAAPEQGTVPRIVERQLRSSGQRLDPAAASFFGSRYGYDFRDVRIHADSEAARSARELSATAFTVGRDIVFGAGRYDPGSFEGRRLIGHELAHVVQQSRPAAPPASGSDVRRLEGYADQAADHAMAGAASVGVHGSAQGGVQLNAEVYIWDPHVDGYGHAAIKLSNGSYISWWPAGQANSKGEQYWSGRPGGGHSYAQDIGPAGEGKGPDHVYDLGDNCLDEAAMWTWYQANFAGAPNPKWSVLRNSCSDVAHQAINQGSSFTNPCYLSLSHSNVFWTPKDLGAYADCQARWCRSKEKGVLNAAGRYTWENTKELAGGAAINSLKSLWWKGEIVVH